MMVFEITRFFAPLRVIVRVLGYIQNQVRYVISFLFRSRYLTLETSLIFYRFAARSNEKHVIFSFSFFPYHHNVIGLDSRVISIIAVVRRQFTRKVHK